MSYDAVNLFEDDDAIGLDAKVIRSERKVGLHMDGVITGVGCEVERIERCTASASITCKKTVCEAVPMQQLGTQHRLRCQVG